MVEISKSIYTQPIQSCLTHFIRDSNLAVTFVEGDNGAGDVSISKINN